MTTISETLQKLWDHNKALFDVKPRKIQVQRAGGIYRARFAGEAVSCFGFTPSEATKRLQFWSEHGKA